MEVFMNSRSPSPDICGLLHDRLDAMLSECDLVMDNADFGQTVHDLDDFLIDAGREFLKEVYQQKLQERIKQIETTPETKQCPDCKKKLIPNTKNRKT
jgi:hypothetical protein